jgi:hypothetical protein
MNPAATIQNGFEGGRERWERAKELVAVLDKIVPPGPRGPDIHAFRHAEKIGWPQTNEKPAPANRVRAIMDERRKGSYGGVLPVIMYQ